ncbi:MAG: RluA family pseudouridine synthase [Planctomycetia bacterium]|nr:RluA family pseudouridine synthase [Planctomycetia bacterium]
MSEQEPSPPTVELVVPDSAADARLDAFLASQLPAYSRVHLRRLINAAEVTVEGRRTKAAHRLRAGERVRVVLSDPPRKAPQPEDIPLDVLYEDRWLAAINKPAGMVVHPAKGHWSGTLAAALQFHFDRLSGVGGPTRPGIVHRLDRDTSGVILVAKDDRVHRLLAAQFERRTIEKEYFAIVTGQPDRDRDRIDRPIGLHPYQREKMAIRSHDSSSRQASSFYEVRERFDGFAAVRIAPKTGRTHQIRVHLQSIGCPVLCDRHYGGRAAITRGEIRRQPEDAEVLLARQALHARSLKLVHPETGQPLELAAPLAQDIEAVLAELRAYRSL